MHIKSLIKNGLTTSILLVRRNRKQPKTSRPCPMCSELERKTNELNEYSAEGRRPTRIEEYFDYGQELQERHKNSSCLDSAFNEKRYYDVLTIAEALPSAATHSAIRTE